MALATQIIAALASLAGILSDLLSGRKTEAEARAESIAAGRLITPGTFDDELAEHEKDAAAADAAAAGAAAVVAGSIAAAIRGASEK